MFVAGSGVLVAISGLTVGLAIKAQFEPEREDREDGF